MPLNYSFNQKHNWRLRFHLQTQTGDITNPNGLCQLNGTYHFFHQHRRLWPDAAHGWGHWESEDLVSWRWCGSPIMPSCTMDKNGSYSGSATIHDGQMWCYYTGNQLLPGKHDYDYSGRLANEILVVSDGEHYGEKRLVLGNESYPSYCSCHVRDPKVWEQDGRWHMLLGARAKGDRGAVLLYGGEDGLSWKLEGSATNTGEGTFGYMWECPNRICLDRREFLLVCPQGVSKQDFAFQNVHDSGYFPLEGTVVDALGADPALMDADGPYPCIDASTFVAWDYGFDFYAPQSFEDEKGRTLLVGWVGLPDIETQYDNPTREWTHTLTVPRVLSLNEAGLVCQWPVPEIDVLRDEPVELVGEGLHGTTGTVGSAKNDEYDLTGAIGAGFAGGACDLEVTDIQGDGRILLNGDLELMVSDGLLELAFLSPAGAYRTVRRLRVSDLSAGRVTDLRVLVDTSVVEIYVNGGEKTLTTRWYPERIDLLHVASTLPATHRAWTMRAATFEGTGE